VWWDIYRTRTANVPQSVPVKRKIKKWSIFGKDMDNILWLVFMAHGLVSGSAMH